MPLSSDHRKPKCKSVYYVNTFKKKYHTASDQARRNKIGLQLVSVIMRIISSLHFKRANLVCLSFEGLMTIAKITDNTKQIIERAKLYEIVSLPIVKSTPHII